MHPYNALLVKKGIEKYLNTRFIKPIDYSEWIANIIPITKIIRKI